MLPLSVCSARRNPPCDVLMVLLWLRMLAGGIGVDFIFVGDFVLDAGGGGGGGDMMGSAGGRGIITVSMLQITIVIVVIII